MKTDVIVIGAGPAGLSFARSTSDTGLDVTVIEKSAESTIANPAIDGRDIALTHPSVKILKNIGAWPRIPGQGISPVGEARVMDGDSPYCLGFDTAMADRDVLGFIVSNHLIRKALYEEVKSVSNVHIIPGTSVTSVSTNNDRAVVVMSSGRSIQAPLLVSADSRFSETRRMMGISASMRDFGRVMIVCQMEHELPHNQVAHECFLYDSTLAVLPLSDNRSSIILTVPTNKAEEKLEMPEQNFNDAIQNLFHHRLGKMTLVGKRYSYPLIGVYADSFVATRFALIGDAAVGMHPVTAHGFNLGLQGQDSLCRAISTALIRGSGIASRRVLRKYQRQHERTARPLYLGTNAVVRLYNSDDFPARIMRKAILRLGNHLTPLNRRIVHQLTG
jgi:ubiquinone biosynthesis UbiH/UbiF/VisC/COQ6 family hydroxylase